MKTNYEIAYYTIKEKILDCTYKPGELLSEKEIVESLNMSRTPVREAIKVLDGEKYLSIILNKGIQIATISVNRMKEIYEVRKVLEVFSIREAFKNITESDVEYLDKLDKQLTLDLENENENAIFKAGMSIHLFIAELSNNEILYDVLKNLREDSLRGYIYFLRKYFKNSSINERDLTKYKIKNGHSELIRAFKNEDLELAIELVLEDLKVYMDLIFKY